MKLYKQLITTDIKTENNDKAKTIERLYILDKDPVVEVRKEKQKSINLKDWTCVAVLSDYRKEPNSTIPKFLVETEIWVNDRYVNAEKTPYWKILKQSFSDEGGEIEIVDNVSPKTKYRLISNWLDVPNSSYSPINSSSEAEDWFYIEGEHYQDVLAEECEDILINCPDFIEEKNLNEDGTIKSMYAKTKDGQIIFGVELNQ